MALPAKYIDYGGVIRQVSNQIFLDHMWLVVLRRVYQKSISRLLGLVPQRKMAYPNKLMVSVLSSLEVANTISPEFLLIEESDDKVNTFGRVHQPRPNYRDKAKGKLRSVLKLLFRNFNELRINLRPFFNDFSNLLNWYWVLRLENVSGIDSLARQRRAEGCFSGLKLRRGCVGCLMV